MDRKIYVVGPQTDYINWMQGTLVTSMQEADLVVFTGGEDVSPFIYDCKPHPLTSPNYDRDMRELEEFKRAAEQGVHMVGICRGAQFLCANAGGILVQHQDNPRFLHQMVTSDGGEILVSSTHHQAQYPWLMEKKEYKVLGWSIGVSAFHQGEGVDHELAPYQGMEVEVAYYPKFKALAIQSHPEMLYPKEKLSPAVHESILWFRVLLNAHLNNLITP